MDDSPDGPPQSPAAQRSKRPNDSSTPVAAFRLPSPTNNGGVDMMSIVDDDTFLSAVQVVASCGGCGQRFPLSLRQFAELLSESYDDDGDTGVQQWEAAICARQQAAAEAGSPFQVVKGFARKQGRPPKKNRKEGEAAYLPLDEEEAHTPQQCKYAVPGSRSSVDALAELRAFTLGTPPCECVGPAPVNAAAAIPAVADADLALARCFARADSSSRSSSLFPRRYGLP